ncbi:hypothetical protein ES319_A04G041000v1 [Gossypium barbadense]|nr:hypothetical protein ES319_A04G041000v1 [Gossypium barbadense]
MGNNSFSKVINIGIVKIMMYDRMIRTFSDVRYVPDLRKNLISLSILDSKGCRINIESSDITMSRGALVLLKGKRTNSLYILEGSTLFFHKVWSFDVCFGMRIGKFVTWRIPRFLRIKKSVDAWKQLFEDVESVVLNDVVGHPNLVPSLDLGFRKLTSLDLYLKLSLSLMFDLEEMCNVPQLQVLFPIVELRSIEQKGHSRHLSLKSLKIVEIERCNNLKYILQSLKEVKVEKCDKLKYLFRLSVDNGLGQLHTLEIKSCSQLEDIIQGPQLPYVSLQSLWEVKSCSQLEDVIQDPQVPYICLLQSLGEVSLIDLPQLKGRDVNDIMLTQLSLRKLETQIQKLVLGRMTYKQLSNICKYEELEQNQTSSHHPLPICSPNLAVIVILECESLKYLFPITIAHADPKMLNVPNLQTLKIEKPSNINHKLSALKEVQVTECNNLKYLFPMPASNNLRQLQTLKIESFQCLREVQVTGCNNLKYLFPILQKERCSLLQEIIQGPEVSISMTHGLPLLNEVALDNLPQLKGGNRNDIVLASPSLHKLKVMGCPQLTHFIISTNIHNYGYNLSSLKILNLSTLIELQVIWNGPIQVGNYQNLTELDVKDCKRLRYIFPLTMARNLPQLWRLDISDCEELEQIIE